jgi:type III secretion system YscQ/HrcQ family protein
MAKKLRKFRWSNLPRHTRSSVRLMNALLAHLPQTPFERDFKAKLRAALEPSLHADFDIWLTTIEAMNGDVVGRRLADPCCAAVIGLVGGGHKALLEVDLQTAQTTIDRLLSGDGSDVDHSRALSEIEEGVFSFVLLKILAVVHETFGGERQWALKLEGLCGSHEAIRTRFELEGDFAVLEFKVFIDSHVGVVRLFLPAAVVDADFSPGWPSPGPALDRLLLSYADRKEMVRLLRASLRVEVGRLSLPMNDLDGLEADDIILLEQTDARLVREEGDDDAPSSLSGQVSCFVGDGAHGSILGSLAVGPQGRYEVAIETIVPQGSPRAMGILFPADQGGMQEPMAEDAHRLNRLTSAAVDPAALAAAGNAAAAARALGTQPRTLPTHESAHDPEEDAEHSDGYEEDDGEPPSTEAAGLLDDVTVAMVVELGRVMVSAADVMGLRAGQVIELSRAPGEPVDLVVDGKRIGKGELVEIDGELGVRILSLSR